MTSANFCYWMQGFFEISDSDTLTEKQVKMIKAHLNLVFKHEIDPMILEDKSELEKFEYTEIHNGKSNGTILSKSDFDKFIQDSKINESPVVANDNIKQMFPVSGHEIKLRC